MENVFLALFLLFLFSGLLAFIRPKVVFKDKPEPEVKKIKIVMVVFAIVFFILFGVTSDASKQNKTQDNQITISTSKNIAQPSTTPQKTPTQNVETNKNSSLINHEVIPDEIHGTLRKITVIIPVDITKEQTIALNDKLIDDYSKGLTHLTIDYFDDKSISKDYFQKLSKVEEKVADDMFSHYRASYAMNKVTNFNQLQFNVNNDWIILKKY